MRPRGLDCASLPDETRVFIEHEVLDIYSRMVNAGCSLQQTLTAVFLSGMSAASAAMPKRLAKRRAGFIARPI
jgi:hypothetical protein